MPKDTSVRLYGEDESDLSEDQKSIFDETDDAKELLKTLLSLFHENRSTAMIALRVTRGSTNVCILIIDFHFDGGLGWDMLYEYIAGCPKLTHGIRRLAFVFLCQ